LPQPSRNFSPSRIIRANQLRPAFTENGYAIFNRYRPPVHPASGGDLAAFDAFFAHLVPDATERTWMWHWLAHKARRPWVPMVAVIMVAEAFGSGRGTLFDILELLFGETYVVPCSFGELTGASPSARFNERQANALFVVVNEAVAEDGHQQAQRRLTYEALKIAIDPSPSARRRFEEKYHAAYAQRSAMSGIIATQHPRCGEAAARRSALQRHHLRRTNDSDGNGDDPGLDGRPGKYRGALPGAAGDAGGAP
jgi:hypothetical protein